MAPSSRNARLDKDDAYPELLSSRGCRLVAFAIDVGGRWNPEAAQFVRMLAQAKARVALKFLQMDFLCNVVLKSLLTPPSCLRCTLTVLPMRKLMLPPASVFSVLRVASAGTFILSLMSAPVAISLYWDLRSAVVGLKKAVLSCALWHITAPSGFQNIFALAPFNPR